jgi:hypothetical protein
VAGLADEFQSFLTFQMKLVQGWLRSEAGGVAEDGWLRTPPGMRNHRWWLLGHLAVSADWSPTLMRVEAIAPESWQGLFGMGSTPSETGEGYPAVGELLDLFDRAITRNIESLPALSADDLAEPPTVVLPDRLAKTFSTGERFLALQTVHVGYHLGQMSQIRIAIDS